QCVQAEIASLRRQHGRKSLPCCQLRAAIRLNLSVRSYGEIPRMSWLGDILKQLELSRTFTAALFVSSLLMLIGPKFFPHAIDTIPGQWRWLVGGTCIFSGALLAFWSAPAVWNWLLNLPSKLRNNPRINVPTSEENGLL